MRNFAFFLLLSLSCWACGDDAANSTEQLANSFGDEGIDQVSLQIQGDPENADLYAARAELFFEKNSFDQAIQDMTIAMSIDSVNLDYHHLLADIYLDYFRSRLALETLQRAAVLHPEDTYTLLKLSELQLFLKQNMASLTNIDKALKVDPQDPLAFYLMGKNFEEMGDTIRAINAYQESVEFDPEMVDSWVKLGQLHSSIDSKMALAFFDNAIEVDSSYTTALHAKAEYLWDQKDREGAMAVYREAVLKDPSGEKSFYNIGLLYLELDSMQQAHQHFSMAIENSPLYVGAYYFRGYASEVMGDVAAAKSDYQHALRLAPEYTDALEGLARVENQ